MSWPDPIPSSGHQLCVACQSKPASDSDNAQWHHSMVSKFDKASISWKLWYQYCPRVTHCHEQRNQFTFIVEILYMLYKIGLDEDLKFLSGQISICSPTHSGCSKPLLQALFLRARLAGLLNMNDGVRPVYHGICNSCRLLSIDMRYNINSSLVVRNNIAHSSCQMSQFCCIMDYLSAISWPFLVPTYPRMLPIFQAFSLVNTDQSCPLIGPWSEHDIIRIDITNIPNYKGHFLSYTPLTPGLFQQSPQTAMMDPWGSSLK